MRLMDEIIVHCTATPAGRPVSVSEVDAWHKARGWSGIGYHYLIGLDGKIDRGRPIEKIGAHVAGHNTGTIGIAYVGGVETDGTTPKDTRTQAQKDALVYLLKKLRDQYGIKKVSGHNEYAAKACPSFDASAEYDHLFPEGQTVESKPDDMLRRGDRGPAVREWRADLAAYRRLIGHPYPVPAGDVFDHTVELVTIWFQQDRGILADGVVGPQTVDEMDRALAGKAPYEAIPSPPIDVPPPPDVEPIEYAPASSGAFLAFLQAILALFRK